MLTGVGEEGNCMFPTKDCLWLTSTLSEAANISLAYHFIIIFRANLYWEVVLSRRVGSIDAPKSLHYNTSCGPQSLERVPDLSPWIQRT